MIKNTKTFGIIMLILSVISLIMISGCGQNIVYKIPGTKYTPGTYEPVSIELGKEVNTKQFKTNEELLNFIKDNSARGDYYGGYRGGVLMETMVKAAAAPSADIAAGPEATQTAPTDYSKTNVQVENVDEADIIKTDGNYIYTITDNVLYIIKAYPGEDAVVVSTIKFDNSPASLFIDGDNLAVFGSFYNIEHFKTLDFRPRSGMTFLNIYNIKDKANPELIKDYKFEGNYFRGRMTGDYAYILTSTTPEYRIDPRPIIFEGTVKRAIPIDHIHYYDIPYQNPVFVNIHAINMKDPSEAINSEAIAVESSQNLYMSEKNIYVTYTEYIDEYELQKQVTMEILEPKLSDADKALIEKIKLTDNDVLSKYEKEAKIYQVYENIIAGMTQDEQDNLQDQAEEKLKKKLEEYKYFEFTVINKVGVDDGKITPSANGKVPGHIMNQFSLDEKDNVLRIATTVSQRWSRFGSQSTKSTNGVYTLDSDLNVLDQLEGLAEDEQIYSTRFIDNRLYMVTFKQVDPFFVIDLSDEKDIKELGKLKIPGFSRYMHPYDEDVIIGIGQDATETGRTKGLKISLFDVSDVNNPKEIAKYVTEERYAQSTALYEHKAFLFSKEKNLLVIPAYNYDYEHKSDNYNGAFVFEIKKDSITLRGLIDHSEGKTEQYWQPSVERSLYIEELLYTKSPNLLRINKISDLSKVKNVELKYTSTTIPIY